MDLLEEIQKIAGEIPGELKEKKGVYTLEAVIAERKAWLTRKKLVYRAKFSLDEEQKELHFTEMLKESGFGLSTGDADTTPGFGFKKETYKTGLGPREGSIEEQSNLFGAKYHYKFEWGKIRKAIEEKAQALGYKFIYHLTGWGL